MLHRIFKRLRERKSPVAETALDNFLKDLLSSDVLRRDVLGVSIGVPPTKEQVLSDARSILRQTESKDYQIWAKEVWSQVLECVDILCSIEVSTGPGTKRPITASEIDFHRGRLKQSLTLLKLSYKARAVATDYERKIQAEKHPVHSRNGQ